MYNSSPTDDDALELDLPAYLQAKYKFILLRSLLPANQRINLDYHTERRLSCQWLPIRVTTTSSRYIVEYSTIGAAF